MDIRGSADYVRFSASIAFMASRVDYCNSLLTVATLYSTGELQCVLNTAADFVSGAKKFDLA